MAVPVETTPVETAPGVMKYDPQGHQMGPLGTIAAQMSVVLGLMWSLGVISALLLPPTVGVLTLAPVLGAFFLAPRSVLMQFPISFSILGIFSITIASIAWTIDAEATSATLRGLVPAMIAVVLAGGLLTLRDLADALLLAIRLSIAITFVALILFPETRLHITTEVGADDYAGWHGFFNHKNNMSAFLVLAVPTVLTFDRNPLTRWPTMMAIGVLLVGSTSATGVSAAFFAGVAWVWLRIYQRQEDARNSTLLFFASLLGSLAVLAGALSSIATITSAYGKDTTFSGRTEIWEASIDAIFRKPWLGHGFGALFWRENVSSETAQIWRQVGFEASHAHNGVLDLTLQIGFIGLAIFAVLWFSTLFRGWGLLREQPDLSIWIVSIVSANLVMSFSEDVFYGGWVGIFALMRMLLMRRPDALYRPSWREGPVAKWAHR